MLGGTGSSIVTVMSCVWSTAGDGHSAAPQMTICSRRVVPLWTGSVNGAPRLSKPSVSQNLPFGSPSGAVLLGSALM